MPFRPSQDYILVRPLERQHSDQLAVITHEKHCRGTVLAVGPGKRDKKGRLKPLDTKVGETVHFGDGNFDFYPRFYEGNECLRIIQEADVCFVEEREEQRAQVAA